MKVTFFIDRPVFSAVISIVIVIVGIIGLTMLPVDQYPQITPPVALTLEVSRQRLLLMYLLIRIWRQLRFRIV